MQTRKTVRCFAITGTLKTQCDDNTGCFRFLKKRNSSGISTEAVLKLFFINQDIFLIYATLNEARLHSIEITAEARKHYQDVNIITPIFEIEIDQSIINIKESHILISPNARGELNVTCQPSMSKTKLTYYLPIGDPGLAKACVNNIFGAHLFNPNLKCSYLEFDSDMVSDELYKELGMASGRALSMLSNYK